MTEPQKPTSWWQTLPGVLAALAAVVTAVSGLLAVLFQNGLLGGKADASAKSSMSTKADAPVAASAAPKSPATAGQSTPAARPWSDAVAVMSIRDGSTTRLRASSLSNCISVGHEIDLDTGQSVPFEKIASIEVLRADDHTAPNAKASLKIELLDGTAISGTADAVCDLFGFNDTGRFSTYFDRLRSIRFDR